MIGYVIAFTALSIQVVAVCIIGYRFWSAANAMHSLMYRYTKELEIQTQKTKDLEAAAMGHKQAEMAYRKLVVKRRDNSSKATN